MTITPREIRKFLDILFFALIAFSLLCRTAGASDLGIIENTDLQKNLAPWVILDTRLKPEWLSGHIPGAVHIEWTKFYSGAERRPLSAEALKKLLKDNDADLQKPVVYYCAAGVRSGFAWLVHQLSGLSPARNYAGGWEAWKRAR